MENILAREVTSSIDPNHKLIELRLQVRYTNFKLLLLQFDIVFECSLVQFVFYWFDNQIDVLDLLLTILDINFLCYLKCLKYIIYVGKLGVFYLLKIFIHLDTKYFCRLYQLLIQLLYMFWHHSVVHFILIVYLLLQLGFVDQLVFIRFIFLSQFLKGSFQS